ncbi:class I SAM-dependent methyltransferase [Paraurantiacibacter namhicola]|uniref:Ubiquinone biosynthesis O-methyltransferase n=1 Tax=Paraurantiacibacter namhicola TaxID=645517 RepID=A0A1C7D6R4_9SPHN|nr:class I SAM-dependent methyltransferase [Paraurantiacibacter namhicola]ANU07147.1 Ubiquinone biosynthesis O-methyltransferase [Paraurantiacibacter namhicola]
MQLGYHSHVRSDIFPYLPRGGKMLDVGGGDGATATAAKQAGIADVVGVADMVEPHPDAQLDFNYNGDLTADGFIERIGEEQGLFDIVTACDILEHLVDPWAMVARLHTLLKPGGVLLATIPNVRHRSVTGPLMMGDKWTYQDAGILDRTHLRFFVRETAVSLMLSSGLQLDEVAALPTGSRIDKTLIRLPFVKGFATAKYLVRVKRPADG